MSAPHQFGDNYERYIYREGRRRPSKLWGGHGSACDFPTDSHEDSGIRASKAVLWFAVLPVATFGGASLHDGKTAGGSMTVTRSHTLMTAREAAEYLAVDLIDLAGLGIPTTQKQKSAVIFYDRAALDEWKAAQ